MVMVSLSSVVRCRLRQFRRTGVAAGLYRLDAAGERLGQRVLPDGSEETRDDPSLEVLALSNQYDVNIGLAVRPWRQGVGVTRGAAEEVGVGRRELDVLRVRPVVMQALPY